MTQHFAHRLMFVILLICQFSICLANDIPDANNSSKYLDAIREFADNVLKYGRDTYGPKHTPLFVDGLNIHTHEPVKWIAPNGDRWILSNLASQQNLFRTLDGLTRITGDPKYKQAAMDATKYAFENLRSPSGLLHWGGHQAYDVGADNPCGRWVHENKGFYPHYQLMWEVNPTATRQLIESFWSGHIVDWSNLDMDRHCYEMNKSLEEAWKHEYKGGPVFFEPKQGIPASFITTAGALVHGAAVLAKLSGDSEPIVWAKRLAHRYVETRDPKTGVGAGIYTGQQTQMPALQEMKDLDLNALGIDSCFPTPPTFGNSDMRRCWYGYCTVGPGIPFNIAESPWIGAMLVGEMMGSEGKEFIQWSFEELTAWGKVAYRKSDNSWVPKLRDGTSLEGLVIKKDGSFGPEGTIVVPISVIPMDFWAYALAYRLTENDFMWQMARNITLGNGFGDIGATSGDLTELKRNIDCADPYALLGFLELYRKTHHKPFLECAKQIGDNILTNRFHKGFFAPSGRHFYARFDSPESLALLHLHGVRVCRHAEVPTMWPSQAFFEHAYRDKEAWDDNSLIYRLTESPEPPISLQEAAARGDLDLIRSLIEKGVEIDSREDSFFKTALHRAAMNGRRDAVELLLDNGANIDARSSGKATALYYAAEKGHKEIAELLIAKGADVNAKRDSGDIPLHSAVKAGHKDITELLIAKGADVDDENNAGQTPLDIAVRRSRKDIIELLLAKGAAISSIHVAAQMGDLARVKAFLEEGADVNAQDDKGFTALHYAVQGGHKELAELLIIKDADVNGKNKYGYSPLYYAIWNEDKDIVRLLVTKAADVNFTPKDDYPLLHYAVWKEYIDVVKLLVAKGAKFDVKDQDGWTAFRYAAWQGNRELVEFFVSRGADVPTFHLAACVGDLYRVKSFIQQGTDIDTKDEMDWTALYWAASMGQEDVAEYLIAEGADVNAKTNYNSTPLHQAAQGGGRKLAELLISRGAEVNTKDKGGDTPLHSAASAGHREVVELLLAKGADLNAKTRYGATPLHSAVWEGQKSTVELLIAKGADINAKDNDAHTPMWYAKNRGHTEIVELLRKHMGGPTSSSKPRHDVVITGVSALSRGPQDYHVPVVVNIENQGDYRESFVVTLTDVSDGKEIGSKSVMLSAAGKGELDDVANLILTGKKSGDQFGDYISTGDVNNDGYEDFLVSAAHYNQKQGRVYLYYGGTNIDENPDKVFTGETIDDWFGNRICLGDVNGDNYDDVIIGAVKYGDVDHQGRAYLYYGDRDMDENADLIFDGETGTQGWFGGTIAAGDVNNDGYDDLFIAAFAYDNNRGRVYLYYGGDPMDTNAAKILDGEGAGNVFGYWLDAGGDVDGNGCKDLLVGTLFYPKYPTDHDGRAYLYYGDTGTSMDEICDVIFTAENHGDEFASSIDVFDIDNDGFGDVLIGARRWPAGGLQGRAYLYWGSSRANMNGHADKIFEGEKGVNACLGGNAIRGGYVNNDDYGDIYIAGYAYPPDFTGRGYLYYGNTKASMDVICDHTFTGYERMSSFGKEAQLADLNNDGLDDIILGAWRYNNFQGRVYLYYSKPGDHTDLTFNWNTTKASPGEHTLKVEIVPVEGEEDAADNTVTVEVDVKRRPESTSRE